MGKDDHRKREKVIKKLKALFLLNKIKLYFNRVWATDSEK